MGSFVDYLTSSAVSLTLSGNTGISPFLTLFLIGALERYDATLLQMDGWMEVILSSWLGIGILGILTFMEFIGKCIPAVDAMIDSVEVFLVPFISILSTLASWGLLDAAADIISTSSGDDTGGGGEQRHRHLESENNALWTIKIILIVFGALIALFIHFCKLILRLVALATCAGLCQPCITMIETSMVFVCIFVAVFIQEVAIVTALIFLIGAGFAFKRKFLNKENNEEPSRQHTNNNSASAMPPTTLNGAHVNNSITIINNTTINRVNKKVEIDEEEKIQTAQVINVQSSDDVESSLSQFTTKQQKPKPPPTNPNYVAESEEI